LHFCVILVAVKIIKGTEKNSWKAFLRSLFRQPVTFFWFVEKYIHNIGSNYIYFHNIASLVGKKWDSSQCRLPFWARVP
jgi:hypothetical protein